MIINTKIIILAGLLILSTTAVNIIISHVQNVIAFSLPGPLDKLFGGLFHKSPSNKTTPIQILHTQQDLGKKLNTSSLYSSLPSTTLSSYTNLTIPTECHIINENRPDPKCTPGSINPSVDQNNVKNTICIPGFSKTIRPPVSYTSPLKVNLMHSYGFTDSRTNYELDHLIPLEVGGNPRSVTNLWPEPGYGQYNFHVKDKFENYLHNAVCEGSMRLDEAQKEIATNWVGNWKKDGQP
ncbi:MAG TPA: hypothetical protein VN703_06755 [Candidatus Sulfopaludibacter sp.]|nr:hypothetical protein [Candidatus Sulfopaludibacter sp.]